MQRKGLLTAVRTGWHICLPGLRVDTAAIWLSARHAVTQVWDTQTAAHMQHRAAASQACVQPLYDEEYLPEEQRVAASAVAMPCSPSTHNSASGATSSTASRSTSNLHSSSSSSSGSGGRRHSRAFELPSVEEVTARLQSHKSASCSTPSQHSQLPAEEELDWRDVVSLLRSHSQHQPAAAMLTDTFGRRHTYLRISLTERCNLRCLYCMPAEGVDLTPSSQLLTSDEIVRLASIFVGAGVNKIRLTGGEPSLRADIVALTGRLAALPGLRALGITSNGIALRRKLPQLRENGLNLINLSLDTLRPERFETMTRRRGHQRVMETIEQAVQLGFDPVKVNVVVMRGQNDDEIADFVELTRHHPINARFIEYMPFDGNVWSNSQMVPYRDMLAAVESAFPQGLVRLQDPREEVAKNFRVAGFRGSVSFITSMTKAFCADCNRLRIMADGNLKASVICSCVCFGANEVSLRDAMREGATDDDLGAIISAAVDRKKAAHAGMFELAKSKNRAMVQIGG